jgi:hypothetical protein
MFRVVNNENNKYHILVVTHSSSGQRQVRQASVACIQDPRPVPRLAGRQFSTERKAIDGYVLLLASEH